MYIDGEYFALEIVEMDMQAEFLDKFAERTQLGDLDRELIGVYEKYPSIKFEETTDVKEFNRLWKKLTEPTEFHTVQLPNPEGDLTFVMYVSGVKAKLLRKYNRQYYFKDLSVTFTPRAPTRR